ncbi:DUF3014 domain-containing protein [Porticoccaceae bacterium]|nr:DUF3014 domain-containing protein [Porticoccaceae bacterium]
MARPPNKTGTSQIILALGTVAAVAVIGGALYQAQKLSDEEERAMMEVIPQQVVTEAVVAAPQVPEAEIPEPEPEIAVQPEAKTTPVMKAPQLPDLDNSDDFVRDRLLLIKHRADVETWLNTDDLIRRTASYMDGLSRGVVLSKIFPLTAPEGNFTTHRDGEGIWLNAGNYERYNSTVAALISLDMASMAKMFHFIRPLLESAFAEMGYRPRQMDGIILQAIDNILATPIIVEPIKLTRDSVAYQFASPELEALPPIQKQLLRTGPENTQRLQQQALALKDALLNP